MRKFIYIIAAILFISLPSLVIAQEENEFDPHATASAQPESQEMTEQIDSYDLFWPVVAGRTRDSKLYFAKLWKEKFRELLTFTNFKKADYNITLSEKRTVEAESLLNAEKYEKAKKTLVDAQNKRDKAFNLVEKAAEDGDKTIDLRNALKSSLEKQRALLIYLQDKLNNDSATDVIKTDLSSLNTTLEKLQQ